MTNHDKLQAISKKIMDKRTKKRGIPLNDGTGRGVRANKGRGGCAPSEQEPWGRGVNRGRKV